MAAKYITCCTLLLLFAACASAQVYRHEAVYDLTIAGNRIDTYHPILWQLEASTNSGKVWVWPNSNGASGQALVGDGANPLHITWGNATTGGRDSGYYVQNLAFPFTETQTANFNINGIGAAYNFQIPDDNYGICTFDGSGFMGIAFSLDHTILVGETGHLPIITTINAGPGIRITDVPGSGSITFSAVADSTGGDSSHYIQNQNNKLQTGKFRISGSAFVGGNDTIGGQLNITSASTGIGYFNGSLLTSIAQTGNGTLIIGNGSSAPVASTLTAGAGISITNGGGTIAIGAIGIPAHYTVTVDMTTPGNATAFTTTSGAGHNFVPYAAVIRNDASTSGILVQGSISFGVTGPNYTEMVPAMNAGNGANAYKNYPFTTVAAVMGSGTAIQYNVSPATTVGGGGSHHVVCDFFGYEY